MKNREKQIDGSGSGSSSGGNRRTYDCDICMRGFTNPQALGGHNNLHRRERESNLSSSSSRTFPFSQNLLSSTNPNHINSPPPTIESYSYHHQAFQPPINPSYNTQYFGSSTSQGGGGNDAQARSEFLGLNLSLGPGSINVDSQRPSESVGSHQPQDDDLDLDLRLGRRHHH